MTRHFDYFILLAEMRTGSNFLEENINEYPGLHCYGELFNPHFIGHARQTELMGIDLAARERDPLALLARIRERTEGIPGFRFFHDHDPRILAHCLDDRRCAKVVLTRNPLDSYISLKIASQTGQWRLNDMKFAKSARVRFDGAEFEAHLNRLQEFQLRLQRALQVSGQTAFYIGYDDLRDVEILNGLARFLGSEGEKKQASTVTKVQNPGAFEEKVTNFGEMQAVL
ncbi:MAG: nodulation protein NodH, partial [Alphaproteobacteria bacterium]